MVKNLGAGAKPRAVRIEQEMPLDEAKLGKAMYIEYYLTPDPAEFRGMDTLSSRIRRQVVLDVHRLAELRFVEGHFLLDPHRARLGRGAEVLDQICHQVVAILSREPQRRGSVAEESFGVRGGRPVGERLAHHVVETGCPCRFCRGPGGKEVFTVADHAGPLRHVAARSWRIDFVVAQLLADR